PGPRRARRASGRPPWPAPWRRWRRSSRALRWRASTRRLRGCWRPVPGSSGLCRRCWARGCAPRSSAPSARGPSGWRGPPGAAALREDPRSEPQAGGAPPTDSARRLLDLGDARGPAAAVTRRLLADAWLVDELENLPRDFGGIAVTVDGECFDARVGELRRLPPEGTDPALAARSEREELASRLSQREQTEERAKRDLELSEQRLGGAQRAGGGAQSRLRG